MPNKVIWSLFWALLGVFILTIILQQVLYVPLLEGIIARNDNLFFVFIYVTRSPFILLGLPLLILAVKADIDRNLKNFLILTGAAAVGIFASPTLHEISYTAFVYVLSADVWQRVQLVTEPFFFIMTIYVCPVAYLVGTIGSIVLMFRKKKNDLG